VAAGRGNGMIYREGKAIRRVAEADIVPALLEEIERFVADRTAGLEAGESAIEDESRSASALPV
jgi:hypothetical protein